MLSNQVQAECPKCNSKSAADAFVLDYLERRMVCPGCFKKARKPTLKEQTEKQKEVVKETKPPGWDKEDEELDKLIRSRQNHVSGKIERVPGAEYVRFTCPSCTFKFKYYPLQKQIVIIQKI